ncbi:hypothetical protein SLA2020_341120 [Shorea laevis]
MNQSYPTVYTEDLKDMWDDMAKVVGVWETVNEKDVDSIKKLWGRASYEKAGVGLVVEFERVVLVKPPVYWEVSVTDVNTKCKSMVPIAETYIRQYNSFFHKLTNYIYQQVGN